MMRVGAVIDQFESGLRAAAAQEGRFRGGNPHQRPFQLGLRFS